MKYKLGGNKIISRLFLPFMSPVTKLICRKTHYETSKKNPLTSKPIKNKLFLTTINEQ